MLARQILRTTALTAAALAVACTGVAAPSAEAAPNGLDSTFSRDGFSITDFGSLIDRGHAVALQPDGRIVVAGEAEAPEGQSREDRNFALARYNHDGSLDTTFGDGGRVTTDIRGACRTTPGYERCGFDVAQAVAVQPDGGIVVAGRSAVSTPDAFFATDFAVARYRADGSLDTTFGTDGKVTTDVGPGEDTPGPSLDGAQAVAVQADGRIIAAGYTQSLAHRALALVRYNADGTLDTSFDGDGTLISGDRTFAHALALQPDGGIVVAGSVAVGESADFLVARYTPAGAADGTFGGDGQVSTDFGGGVDSAAAVAIQPDGRIVAAGTRGAADGGDFALARYGADGSPDESFGGDGTASTDLLDADTPRAVLPQADGGVVVAGTAAERTTTDGGFVLARYDARGALDANGGDDGVSITDFGGENRYVAAGAVLQPDGRVVVAGYTGFVPCTCVPSDFVVARYKPAGSLRVDAPGHREVHTCVNGSFVDLNVLFGVPEQVVCGATINAGQPWRPMMSWFVGDVHYEVPPGYVPAADTPLADLVSKLEAVKVVVDGGTRHARTTTFNPDQALRTEFTLDQLDREAPPLPMAITLPRMQPLKVGEHTIEVLWVLGARHCDGLGGDAAGNCLPAGDVSFGRRRITVAAP